MNDLFVDWNRTDSDSNSVFGDAGDVLEYSRYYNCQSLNDERMIKFHQGWKQDGYVFNEKLQIWIDGSIDVEKDNLFVPRVDAQ